MVMSNEKSAQEYSWTTPIQLALLEKPRSKTLRKWLQRDLHNVAHALARLQQLTNTTVYLAWRNPELPLEPFKEGAT